MDKLMNTDQAPEYTLKVTANGFTQSVVIDGVQYDSKVTTEDGVEFEGDVELGKLMAADGVKDRPLIMELLLTSRQAKMLCIEMREATL